MNNKLYFFADSIYTTNSSALWVTDGTPAGTKWVSHAFYSLYQFSYTSYQSSFLTSYNNRLYFGAADNLWVSNGTDTGTKILKVFETEADLCCTPTNITFFNGQMYMRVKDFSGRVEICSSNGTETGTHEVVYPTADFETSSSFVYYNYLCMPLTVVGTKLFFWNTYLDALGHSLYVIDLQDESVKAIHAIKEINIYPNPALDIFNIVATSDIKINRVEVLNISGQLVATQPVNGQNKMTIDMKTDANGLYIVKTYTNEGIFNNQLVVRH
jgi:ELWxxDGT repeat protein